MILYLDASAWLKRYLVEPGSDVLQRAAVSADKWFMSRIGFIEVLAALGRTGSERQIDEFHADWARIDVLEVREPLAERAAELAISDRLGALDAVHLASALRLPGEDVVFATWDRRLHAAAQARGLATLPETLA